MQPWLIQWPAHATVLVQMLARPRTCLTTPLSDFWLNLCHLLTHACGQPCAGPSADAHGREYWRIAVFQCVRLDVYVQVHVRVRVSMSVCVCAHMPMCTGT